MENVNSAFTEVDYHGFKILKFMANACESEKEDIIKYGRPWHEYGKKHIRASVSHSIKGVYCPNGVNPEDYRDNFLKALKFVYNSFNF